MYVLHSFCFKLAIVYGLQMWSWVVKRRRAAFVARLCKTSLVWVHVGFGRWVESVFAERSLCCQTWEVLTSCTGDENDVVKR